MRARTTRVSVTVRLASLESNFLTHMREKKGEKNKKQEAALVARSLAVVVADSRFLFFCPPFRFGLSAPVAPLFLCLLLLDWHVSRVLITIVRVVPHCLCSISQERRLDVDVVVVVDDGRRQRRARSARYLCVSQPQPLDSIKNKIHQQRTTRLPPTPPPPLPRPGQDAPSPPPTTSPAPPGTRRSASPSSARRGRSGRRRSTSPPSTRTSSRSSRCLPGAATSSSWRSRRGSSSPRSSRSRTRRRRRSSKS